MYIWIYVKKKKIMINPLVPGDAILCMELDRHWFKPDSTKSLPNPMFPMISAVAFANSHKIFQDINH